MFIRFRVLLPSATYIPMSLYGSVLVSMICIMGKSSGRYYQSTEELLVGQILQEVVPGLRKQQAADINLAVKSA